MKYRKGNKMSKKSHLSLIVLKSEKSWLSYLKFFLLFLYRRKNSRRGKFNIHNRCSWNENTSYKKMWIFLKKENNENDINTQKNKNHIHFSWAKQQKKVYFSAIWILYENKFLLRMIEQYLNTWYSICLLHIFLLYIFVTSLISTFLHGQFLP